MSNSENLATLGLPISFQALLSSPGYQRFPSGLIIQWGSGTWGDQEAVAFPIPFPNTVFAVVMGAGNFDFSEEAWQKVVPLSAYNQTNAGFSASSATGNPATGAWVAFGN